MAAATADPTTGAAPKAIVPPETVVVLEALATPATGHVRPAVPATLAATIQSTAHTPAAIPSPAEREPVSAGGWIRRGALALGAIGLVAAAARYVPPLFSKARQRVTSIAANPPQPSGPAPAARATGSLKVTSTPDRARVLIDGRERGVTPLSLDDLPPGNHLVVVESSRGTVRRSIAIAPGTTTQVDEQIFDGFVAVFSPIEVVISEDERVLRPDDHNTIIVPAGTHRLRFTNRGLAYEEVRSVDVKPGGKVVINLTPPPSSVSVTASDAAEVFLDGTKIGDTPVTNVPTAIGTHNLVVKRANGTERRMPITVTVKPFSLAVEF